MSSGNEKTILVADDETHILNVVSLKLRNAGYRVLTASDAWEAEAILARETVDLLFTDIDLARNTNGIMLARSARAHCPGLPVVYTSGGRACLAHGEAVSESVFVPKPYRPSQLVALTNDILGHVHPHHV